MANVLINSWTAFGATGVHVESDVMAAAEGIPTLE